MWQVYTVVGEEKGYSSFAKREVEAYELKGMDGLYEKGIFIPIDENKFDTVLKKVLSVPKMSRKNYNAPEKK